MLRRSTLRLNIAALGVLQVANYALVLVALPYLTSHLGPGTWGRIVFVQTIANYGMWIGNWGFYLSATREVSEHRHDRARLAAIYQATWFAQLLLTAASTVAMLVVAICVPGMRRDFGMYVAAVGLLVGNALAPLWFLNGLEHIRESAALQILSKLIATPCFFLLIRQPDHAWRYFAINSIASLIAGAVTLSRVRRYGATHAFPGWPEIRRRLREGTTLFLSSAWGNVYSTLPTLVLGSIAGPAALGLFNVADRVRGAVTTVVNPVTHSLFPRMCHLYATDLVQARRLLLKSGLLLGAAMTAFSLGIWALADRIPIWIGGTQYAGASAAMRWLAFVPVLTTGSLFFVHQVIIPAKQPHIFHRIMVITALVTALAAYPLIRTHGATGAAELVFTAELAFLVMAAGVSIKNRFYFTVAS